MAPVRFLNLVKQWYSSSLRSKLIDVDKKQKEDRDLFDGATKLFGFIITIGEAVAYVISGMYGDLSNLGAINAYLIIIQLVVEESSFFFWMKRCKKDMVLEVAFRFSLRLTYAKISYGKLSPRSQSQTSLVTQNMKVLSYQRFIYCWLDLTKYPHFKKHFIDHLVLTFSIWSQLSLSSSLSSTSRDSNTKFKSATRTIKETTGHTQ